MLPKRNKMKCKTRSQPRLQLSAAKTPKQTQPSHFAKSKYNSTYSQTGLQMRNIKNRRSLQEITKKLNVTKIQFMQSQKCKQKFIDNYIFEMEIGQGAFGKVWRVLDVSTKRLYALKVMQKGKIILKRSVFSVLNQRIILSRLKQSLFIVNPINASQDERNLYLLMEYMPGGDLRYLMFKYRRSFNQQQTKFLICCLLIGINHLHKNFIVHRDIKPENLVIDDKGYLRITDMGISKIVNNKMEPDNSGTPAYMAPEALQFNMQTYSVDYYAVGVIAYQLLNGKRPYQSKTREQIKREIRDVAFKGKNYFMQFPQKISQDCIDFIKKLIQINPQKRLGSRGSQQIYKHKWFSGIQWSQFKKKKYISPFIEQIYNKNYQLTLQNYNNLLQQQNKQNINNSVEKFWDNIDKSHEEAFKKYNYNFR